MKLKNEKCKLLNVHYSIVFSYGYFRYYTIAGMMCIQLISYYAFRRLCIQSIQ